MTGCILSYIAGAPAESLQEGRRYAEPRTRETWPCHCQLILQVSLDIAGDKSTIACYCQFTQNKATKTMNKHCFGSNRLFSGDSQTTVLASHSVSAILSQHKMTYKCCSKHPRALSLGRLYHLLSSCSSACMSAFFFSILNRIDEHAKRDAVLFVRVVVRKSV